MKTRHPEICVGTAVLGNPLPFGWSGQSTIPFVIIIDPFQSRDMMAANLAHECMHKRDGLAHGVWDYWFNDEKDHNQIYEDAEKIRREYEDGLNGEKCKNETVEMAKMRS